jgi:hypothetical protein
MDQEESPDFWACLDPKGRLGLKENEGYQDWREISVWFLLISPSTIERNQTCVHIQFLKLGPRGLEGPQGRPGKAGEWLAHQLRPIKYP